MAGRMDYPVELSVEYSERVNRVLWLVKGILLVPHFLVLAVVGIPVLLTVPLAWAAVVVLGRCPGFLWGYHCGLLRWGWRVGFYGSEAGNTDRYPPFAFGPRDDYPADLMVEYPESSSRLTGLVRWVLVLPHWVVLYFLNIIRGILVVVAMLVVLVTGRYPEGLFDVVMGINRWDYRVAAYSVLLVDDYPPFSFE